MKRNLDHSALPSAEEIKLYQEGKLSPARTHEIEMMAEENPMLGDALEGYAILPLFGAVPGISSAVAQQAASASTTSGGSSAVASSLKSSTSWWHLSKWMIGLGVSVVTVITTVTIFKNNAKETLTEKTKVDTEMISDETQIEMNGVVENGIEGKDLASNSKNDIVFQPSVSNTKSISENKIVIEESKRNDATELSIVIAESNVKGSDSSVIVLENNSVFSDEAVVLKPTNTTLVAVSVVRYKNYRIADYDQLRKTEWEVIALGGNGVSANYESSSDKVNALELDKKTIPYLSYIKSNIDAYDMKEYRIAIAGFLDVLTQYPDDVNAQFYGAMSYYHHEQPVLALQLLERAEKNPIKTFREEVQFYKAKCLKMLNKTEDASTIFKKIVSDNGFYKLQAQKELLD